MSVSRFFNSVGVEVFSDDTPGEPKLRRKSIGPSSFTVRLPVLPAAATPMMMMAVNSTPMRRDLMSMDFIVRGECTLKRGIGKVHILTIKNDEY